MGSIQNRGMTPEDYDRFLSPTFNKDTENKVGKEKFFQRLDNVRKMAAVKLNRICHLLSSGKWINNSTASQKILKDIYRLRDDIDLRNNLLNEPGVSSKLKKAIIDDLELMIAGVDNATKILDKIKESGGDKGAFNVAKRSIITNGKKISFGITESDQQKRIKTIENEIKKLNESIKEMQNDLNTKRKLEIAYPRKPPATIRFTPTLLTMEEELETPEDSRESKPDTSTIVEGLNTPGTSSTSSSIAPSSPPQLQPSPSSASEPVRAQTEAPTGSASTPSVSSQDELLEPKDLVTIRKPKEADRRKRSKKEFKPFNPTGEPLPASPAPAPTAHQPDAGSTQIPTTPQIQSPLEEHALETPLSPSLSLFIGNDFELFSTFDPMVRAQIIHSTIISFHEEMYNGKLEKEMYNEKVEILRNIIRLLKDETKDIDLDPNQKLVFLSNNELKGRALFQEDTLEMINKLINLEGKTVQQILVKISQKLDTERTVSSERSSPLALTTPASESSTAVVPIKKNQIQQFSKLPPQQRLLFINNSINAALIRDPSGVSLDPFLKLLRLALEKRQSQKIQQPLIKYQHPATESHVMPLVKQEQEPLLILKTGTQEFQPEELRKFAEHPQQLLLTFVNLPEEEMKKFLPLVLKEFSEKITDISNRDLTDESISKSLPREEEIGSEDELFKPELENASPATPSALVQLSESFVIKFLESSPKERGVEFKNLLTTLLKEDPSGSSLDQFLGSLRKELEERQNNPNQLLLKDHSLTTDALVEPEIPLVILQNPKYRVSSEVAKLLPMFVNLPKKELTNVLQNVSEDLNKSNFPKSFTSITETGTEPPDYRKSSSYANVFTDVLSGDVDEAALEKRTREKFLEKFSSNLTGILKNPKKPHTDSELQNAVMVCLYQLEDLKDQIFQSLDSQGKDPEAYAVIKENFDDYISQPQSEGEQYVRDILDKGQSISEEDYENRHEVVVGDFLRKYLVGAVSISNEGLASQISEIENNLFALEENRKLSKLKSEQDKARQQEIQAAELKKAPPHVARYDLVEKLKSNESMISKTLDSIIKISSNNEEIESAKTELLKSLKKYHGSTVQGERGITRDGIKELQKNINSVIDLLDEESIAIPITKKLEEYKQRKALKKIQTLRDVLSGTADALKEIDLKQRATFKPEQTLALILDEPEEIYSPREIMNARDQIRHSLHDYVNRYNSGVFLDKYPKSLMEILHKVITTKNKDGTTTVRHTKAEEIIDALDTVLTYLEKHNHGKSNEYSNLLAYKTKLEKVEKNQAYLIQKSKENQVLKALDEVVEHSEDDVVIPLEKIELAEEGIKLKLHQLKQSFEMFYTDPVYVKEFYKKVDNYLVNENRRKELSNALLGTMGHLDDVGTNKALMLSSQIYTIFKEMEAVEENKQYSINQISQTQKQIQEVTNKISEKDNEINIEKDKLEKMDEIIKEKEKLLSMPKFGEEKTYTGKAAMSFMPEGADNTEGSPVKVSPKAPDDLTQMTAALKAPKELEKHPTLDKIISQPNLSSTMYEIHQAEIEILGKLTGLSKKIKETIDNSLYPNKEGVTDEAISGEYIGLSGLEALSNTLKTCVDAANSELKSEGKISEENYEAVLRAFTKVEKQLKEYVNTQDADLRVELLCNELERIGEQIDIVEHQLEFSIKKYQEMIEAGLKTARSAPLSIIKILQTPMDQAALNKVEDILKKASDALKRAEDRSYKCGYFNELPIGKYQVEIRKLRFDIENVYKQTKQNYEEMSLLKENGSFARSTTALGEITSNPSAAHTKENIQQAKREIWTRLTSINKGVKLIADRGLLPETLRKVLPAFNSACDKAQEEFDKAQKESRGHGEISEATYNEVIKKYKDMEKAFQEYVNHEQKNLEKAEAPHYRTILLSSKIQLVGKQIDKVEQNQKLSIDNYNKIIEKGLITAIKSSKTINKILKQSTDEIDFGKAKELLNEADKALNDVEEVVKTSGYDKELDLNDCAKEIETQRNDIGEAKTKVSRAESEAIFIKNHRNLNTIANQLGEDSLKLSSNEFQNRVVQAKAKLLIIQNDESLNELQESDKKQIDDLVKTMQASFDRLIERNKIINPEALQSMEVEESTSNNQGSVIKSESTKAVELPGKKEGPQQEFFDLVGELRRRLLILISKEYTSNDSEKLFSKVDFNSIDVVYKKLDKAWEECNTVFNRNDSSDEKDKAVATLKEAMSLLKYDLIKLKSIEKLPKKDSILDVSSYIDKVIDKIEDKEKELVQPTKVDVKPSDSSISVDLKSAKDSSQPSLFKLVEDLHKSMLVLNEKNLGHNSAVATEVYMKLRKPWEEYKNAFKKRLKVTDDEKKVAVDKFKEEIKGLLEDLNKIKGFEGLPTDVSTNIDRVIDKIKSEEVLPSKELKDEPVAEVKQLERELNVLEGNINEMPLKGAPDEKFFKACMVEWKRIRDKLTDLGVEDATIIMNLDRMTSLLHIREINLEMSKRKKE